jgi:hypothetical protein
MKPDPQSDYFEIGQRVERFRSPKDSLVKDGARGVVTEILQTANGELGYFVRFAPGVPPTFCAGTRLFAVAESEAETRSSAAV